MSGDSIANSYRVLRSFLLTRFRKSFIGQSSEMVVDGETVLGVNVASVPPTAIRGREVVVIAANAVNSAGM